MIFPIERYRIITGRTLKPFLCREGASFQLMCPVHEHGRCTIQPSGYRCALGKLAPAPCRPGRGVGALCMVAWVSYHESRILPVPAQPFGLNVRDGHRPASRSAGTGPLTVHSPCEAVVGRYRKQSLHTGISAPFSCAGIKPIDQNEPRDTAGLMGKIHPPTSSP
jgi:hypothetical protein